MIRFGLVLSSRTRIAVIGSAVFSLAVTAWAWQAPSRPHTGIQPNRPGAGSENPSGTVTPLPQAVHTNRATFRIPFQFDKQEISRLGASEIRLYASLDNGAQWQHVQTVEPAAQKFEFQASVDGEYWFTVQTVDRNGQLHPGGPVMQPGLIVAVDSAQPTLQLELQQGQPGQVQLRWTSDDVAIDAQSLNLEYTQTGSPDWQQVAVLPAASGQTSWSVPLGGLVAVRGQIRDLAGNAAAAQTAVQIDAAAAGPNPALQVPDLNGPVAGRTSNPSLPGSLGPGSLDPLPSARTGLAARPEPVPYSSSSPPLSTGSRGTAQNRFPLLPARQPVGSGPAATSPGFTEPGGGLASRETSVWPRDQTRRFTRPEDFRQASRPYGGQDLLTSSQNPTAQRQFPAFTEPVRANGIRTVTSRRFHIDYQIDDVGPSGVSSVELYVTQNNGEKWYRYGLDEDRQSPFEVEVPGDGTYGFSMRVVSGAGLVDPPPRQGHEPEIVIVADASPPVVNLFPLQQGTGANTNRILITWEVQDRELGERPISLSYSVNPDGPWEPISPWLPNTGQHIWTITAQIPPRLYVRVIARDTAGNVAKMDTPQPVLVDLARPTARIVDVESSQANASRNY